MAFSIHIQLGQQNRLPWTASVLSPFSRIMLKHAKGRMHTGGIEKGKKSKNRKFFYVPSAEKPIK
jgi:hypothetical protein